MKRSTQVLLMSSFVTNVGAGIYWPFLGLRLYDLGASYFQIALLDSLSAIMFMLSRVWGATSDYYGLRKPFIIVGSILSAVPIFFCGLVSSPLYVIALFMASSFFSSVNVAPFLAALTFVEEKGKIMGWYSMLTAIGWAFGTFSMGIIHEYFGAFGVFTIAAVLIIVAASIIFWHPSETRLTQDESLRGYVKNTFTFKFKAPKEFAWLLLAVFLCWFGFQWSGPLMRMRFYDLLEHSVIMLGIVWGVSASISGAIVSPLAGRLADKIGGGRMIQAAVLVYMFYTPLFAFVNSPLLYSVLWIVPIWTFNWVGVLSTTAQMTSESVRGEAMGLFNVALNLGVIVGLLGGVFADNFGRELAIVVTPIFFIAAWLSIFHVVEFYKARSENKHSNPP